MAVKGKRKPSPGLQEETKDPMPAVVESVATSHSTKLWLDEQEMDDIVEKKRKSEEAENYNKPVVRSKQAQAVAREVARRSLRASRKEQKADGTRVEDLGFALTSSASPGDDVAPVPAALTEDVNEAPMISAEDMKKQKELEARWAKKSKKARRHARLAQKKRTRKAQGGKKGIADATRSVRSGTV